MKNLIKSFLGMLALTPLFCGSVALAKSAIQTKPENGQIAKEAKVEDKKNPSPEDKLIESLHTRNPFFADPTQALGAEQTKIIQAPKGLQLRSISCVNGKWLFGIADTALKKYYIVPLGKKSEINACPYFVDFYDDETNSISVSDDTAFYTLTLKEPDVNLKIATQKQGTTSNKNSTNANQQTIRVAQPNQPR